MFSEDFNSKQSRMTMLDLTSSAAAFEDSEEKKKLSATLPYVRGGKERKREGSHSSYENKRMECSCTQVRVRGMPAAM